MSYIRRSIESVLGLGVCNGKPSPRTVNKQLLTLTGTCNFNKRVLSERNILTIYGFGILFKEQRCCPSDVQMVSASHYFSPWDFYYFGLSAELSCLVLTVRQRSSNCDTEGQSSLLLPMLLASASSMLVVALVIHLSVRKDFSARNFNAVPPSTPNTAFLTLSRFYSWH